MIVFHTPDTPFWKALRARTEAAAPALPIRAVSSIDELSLADREAVAGLVCFGLSEADSKLLPALRAVFIPMAGVNTLPLEALATRGISVVNAHANGNWVAERALALLLAQRGKIVTGDRDLREGRWHGFAAGEPVAESWRSIQGKTIAVLGTGSIGQWFARFSAPFGVRCVGFRRTPGEQGIPAGLFERITTDIIDAVTAADAVVVTLPLTPETRGLVGSREIEAMRGAVLVNVGRGAVVDEEALFNALSDGVLAGAAIDTWYRYPNPPGEPSSPSDFPFEELETVVLSPHLGGYNQDATTASAEEIIGYVEQWCRDYVAVGEWTTPPGTISLADQY